MKNKFLLAGFAILVSISSLAQKSECLEDFIWLVEKIKNDYPGYVDKVHGEKAIQLEQLELDLRNRIENYPDSCSKYLDTYASWFHDHHLRDRHNWSHSGNTSEVKNSEEGIRYANVKVDGLANTDETIEGIWLGFRGEMAIVEQGDAFVAVPIQYPGYEQSQVMYEFSSQVNNELTTIAYFSYNDYRPSNTKASLHLENKVLEIHGDTKFVRKTNNEMRDKAFLYSYTASFPNGRNTYSVATYLSDSTYYLRIPGFYSEQAEVFVTQHWEEIISRPNLIIDIRNNGGGQDTYYQVLSQLIYTTPYESKGVEWFASKGNIKYFEDAITKGEINDGEDGLEWTNVLLEEMRENVDGFVIHPMMGQDVFIEKDTVYEYPKRVGIIINEGNGSSA